MSERELSELAAKAAGLVGEWSSTLGGWPCLVLPGHHAWQPIHDDGDALRLAVTLNLDILQDPASARTNAVEVVANEPADAEAKPWVWEHRAPDPFAATRRAIVRAAAEIGRHVP